MKKLIVFILSLTALLAYPSNVHKKSYARYNDDNPIKKIKERKRLKRFGRSQRVEGELIVRFKSKGNRQRLMRMKRFKNRNVQNINKNGKELLKIKFDESGESLESVRREVLSLPNVEFAEPNILLKSLSRRQIPQRKLKKTLFKIREKRSSKNKKVKVGIMDSGIDDGHPDLQGQLGPGVNLIYDSELNKNSEQRDSTTMDYHGHGTQMAGVIGALHNDEGIDGFATHVSLHPVKVFDQHGDAWLDDVIEGLEWCALNEMDIINMSFGTYEYSQIFEDAIEQAANAGVILIAASGNDFSGESMYPGKFKGVYSVGSHDAEHYISRFSNWGPEVDFFVDGNKINTTSTYMRSENNPYATVSGTSIAAAIVSGALAHGLELGVPRKQLLKLVRDYSFDRYHQRNPSSSPYRELSVSSLFDRLHNIQSSNPQVMEFNPKRKYFSPGEKVDLTYKIKDIGTAPRPLPGMQLRLTVGGVAKILASELDRKGAAGKPKNVSFSFIPQKVFSDFPFENRRYTSLIAEILLPDGKSLHTRSFHISTQPSSRVELNSFYVSGLSKKESGGFRSSTAKIVFTNVGQEVLSNLTLRIKVSNNLHEAKEIRYVTLVEGKKIKPLSIGQTAQLEVPLPGFDGLGTELSFYVHFFDNNQVVEAVVDNFDILEKNQIRLQYNRDTHTSIAIQSLELLEKSGVYFKDLEKSNWMGEEGEYSTWPGLVEDLPSNEIVVTEDELKLAKIDGPSVTWSTFPITNGEGYWTQEVMDNIKGFYNLSSMSFADGSADCDVVDIAFNYSKDTKDTWDTHFWIVDSDDDDGLGEHHSALTKIRHLMFGKNHPGAGSDGYLVHGAIDHYKAGHKEAAWWMLGHAIHLIGDISVPSHVNKENSHGGPSLIPGQGGILGTNGAPYHYWMDEAHGRWSAEYINNRFINPYLEDTEGDPVRFLAYTTAQVGNSFPYAYTCSNCWDGKGGNRLAGGQSPHYEEYMEKVFENLPSYPLSKREINAHEVWDHVWDECQEEWTIGYWEDWTDCWGGGNGHIDIDNTDGPGAAGNDDDGDLTRIGDHAYVYSIRAAAGLVYYFLQETGQLNYRMVSTVFTPLLLN